MKTAKVTNSIIHVIDINNDQFNCVIKIRLNDECKNRHNDFAITGSFWDVHKRRSDRNLITAGACHDAILKARPDLKLFVDLHLSTADGVPMYAIENGFFHLKQTGIEVAREYMRCTSEEIEVLNQAEDKVYFQYLVESIGLPERWKSEADSAIKLLEDWTGETFEDDSTRKTFVSLNDEVRNDIAAKINSGYYSPESIAERVEESRIAANKKILQDLESKRKEKIQKINNEFLVQSAVHNAGLSLENFIYYDHTNEGHFNWLSYEKKITTEQLSDFIRTVDYSQLPEGIIFKMSPKSH